VGIPGVRDIVEVRGVEPRSEEKILKTSTYMFCPFDSPWETPADWIDPKLSQVLPLPGFMFFPCARKNTIPSERRSQDSRWERNQENGMLKLVKQPVRSCSWHLIVYRLFSVDTETTVCSPERPHPRRSQVTPMSGSCKTNILTSCVNSNSMILRPHHGKVTSCPIPRLLS